jgi:hypothetical protein
MSRTANLVKSILENSQDARNSDKVLLHDYLQHKGIGFNEKQTDIFLSVNFETITRIRRKLQEEGLYLADAETSRQRKLKASIVKEVAPIAPSSSLADALDIQPNQLELDEL